MNNPIISVILPAYNAEQFLNAAIESILNQTFSNFEFIIVDDGSTDKTSEIIHSYHDSRIVNLNNVNNLGIVSTLNNGLLHANGKYIARMDADDISYPNRFEIQYNYLEKHKNVGVVGSGIELFGNTDKKYRLFSNSSKMLKAELLFSSCLPHPTAMIRKSIMQNFDLKYNEEFSGREDFALWWEISKYSDIGMISQVLHKYRVHEKQITAMYEEQKSNISRKFLKYRISDIGYAFSENEEDVFLQYCLGKYNNLSKNEILIFIKCLSNIIKINKNTNYFSPKELEIVCSLGILESIKHLSDIERRECFKYALNNKALSCIVAFKYFVHSLIK